MRAPNTGCASVGFAPQISSTSDSFTSWKLFVPAPVPSALPSAWADGEWHTREQLSIELVPITTRANFCMM